jgi:predicted RNA-binding Zn-ribbon protein involved in translation (DUF1610 family)
VSVVNDRKARRENGPDINSYYYPGAKAGQLPIVAGIVWLRRIAAVGSRKPSYGETLVAIKRPSKTQGTPVRKSVTSPGLRRVDVRLPRQMVPGDLYLGWVCKNRSCGLVIAIAPTQAVGTAASTESDDQLAAIKCPHCGDEDLYRWGTRSEHQYMVGSTTV